MPHLRRASASAMLCHAAQCTRNTHPLPSQPDHRHTEISQGGNNSARKLASLFVKSDANLHAGYSCMREESAGIPLQSALVCGDFKAHPLRREGQIRALQPPRRHLGAPRPLTRAARKTAGDDSPHERTSPGHPRPTSAQKVTQKRPAWPYGQAGRRFTRASRA